MVLAKGVEKEALEDTGEAAAMAALQTECRSTRDSLLMICDAGFSRYNDRRDQFTAFCSHEGHLDCELRTVADSNCTC